MRSFFVDIAGGLVVFVIAAAAGLAHNAVRERSLPLIQNVKHNSPGRHQGAQATGPKASSAAGSIVEEALREGSVTADQVKALLEDSTVVVIDARSPQEYEEGHITGATNVPYDRLPEYYQRLIGQIPFDAFIVCYCTGPDCDFSDQLATELRIAGYMKVVLFPGGWEHWEAAGYPAEGSKVKK
jgi:rhodanese-related sulfurtransferase